MAPTASMTPPRHNQPSCLRLRTLARTGLIFVHIPKNAGTSVESALLEQRSCTESRSCKGHTWGRSPPLLHATSAEYQRACNATLFHSVPSAAILRRPLDRARSMYLYFSSGGNGSPDDLRKFASIRALHKAHGARLGFQEFVERLAQENESWTQEILFRPQSEFVLHGRIVDDAESAISVTWLLCTERLSNDWAALQRALPALRKIALPSKPQRASAPSTQRSPANSTRHADTSHPSHTRGGPLLYKRQSSVE